MDESENTNLTDQQSGQTESEGSMEFDPKIKVQVEELVKELTAKQFQALQSMQAKQEDRVKREIDKRLEAIANAGLKITPEQAARIQEDTRKQLASEESQSVAKREEAQPKAQQQSEIHPVVATANEIMKSFGVEVENNDPEFKMIDQSTKDAWQFLQSVREAANAKAQRLAESQTKQFDPARTPGVVGAGDHGSNLEAKYREEAKKLQGNVEGLYQLKMKYRGMGLKV